MEIGNKIKRLRLQLNLSQAELADRCELTKGYISQLENDLTSPSISTLCDILSALGTDLAEFFKREDDQRVVFSDEDFIEKHENGMLLKWIIPNAQKNEMEPVLVVALITFSSSSFLVMVCLLSNGRCICSSARISPREAARAVPSLREVGATWPFLRGLRSFRIPRCMRRRCRRT